VAFPLFQKYIDKKRLLLTKYKAWHQIGGHFINYDDSYADMMMLEEMPVCVGVTRLGFCKTGRHAVKKIKCEMITP